MPVRAKRLFIILDNYWGQCRGGAELQAHYLEKAALTRGMETHYYFLSNGQEYSATTGTRLIPVRRKQIWTRLNDIKYPYARSLYWALKQAAPDIIYQRCAMSLTGIAAGFAKRHHCKLVFHIASDRDLTPMNFTLKHLPLAPEIALTRYGIKNASTIIAQTKAQANALNKHYQRNAIVIPNGHPVPKPPLKPVKPVTIIWVANWKSVKQPQHFICLAKALKGMPNLKMIMAGHIGRFSSLAREAESAGIEVTGGLSNRDINALLDTSHLLVNTSKHEGFSNTFIQAWLREVPVISLTADPDHIIRDKGFGICSGSMTSLIHDTRHLINRQDLRERMGKKARTYASRHFSTQNMERILKVMSCDR